MLPLVRRWREVDTQSSPRVASLVEEWPWIEAARVQGSPTALLPHYGPVGNEGQGPRAGHARGCRRLVAVWP